MYPQKHNKNQSIKNNKSDHVRKKSYYENMSNDYNPDFNIIAVYERENGENNTKVTPILSNDVVKRHSNVKRSTLKLRRSQRILESRGKKRNNTDLLNNIKAKYQKITQYEIPYDPLTEQLRNQVLFDKLKNSENDLRNKIQEEIDCINSVLIDNVKLEKMSSHKRKIEVECEDIVKPVQLIPQSQWVYSTPDKQKIKKVVAKETHSQIMPAVYHTNKKMKVLYNLKEELVGKVNVDKFAGGQKVQIDKRFLQPICEVALDDNASNQFLSNDSEHSIELKDVNFNTDVNSRQFVQDVPMNYIWTSASNAEDSMDIDTEIYQVCTQRPAKSSKKLSRLNSLERRTLSFDDTPKRLKTVQKHKSDNFLQNLSLSDPCQEQTSRDASFCSSKTPFHDSSNLIDNNRPSTSKGIYKNLTNDVENMCLLSDTCSNLSNDCEFFDENLWPDMPEMLSPKPLNMFPRKV